VPAEVVLAAVVERVSPTVVSVVPFATVVLLVPLKCRKDVLVGFVAPAVVDNARRHWAHAEQDLQAAVHCKQKPVVFALGFGAVQFVAELRFSSGMSKPCSP